MTKKAATEEVLGELHAKVATVMTNMIVAIDRAQEDYLNRPEDAEYEAPPEVSAAALGVVTKFLNDNKISCAPADSNELSGLERTLADKQARRGKLRLVNHEDDESIAS